METSLASSLFSMKEEKRKDKVKEIMFIIKQHRRPCMTYSFRNSHCHSN